MDIDFVCPVSNLFESEDETCCPKRCYLNFDEETLKEIHLNIKGLPTETKRAYICGNLTAKRPIQKEGAFAYQTYIQ